MELFFAREARRERPALRPSFRRVPKFFRLGRLKEDGGLQTTANVGQQHLGASGWPLRNTARRCRRVLRAVDKVVLTRTLIGTKRPVGQVSGVLLGTGAVGVGFDCMQLSRTCSHGLLSERLQSNAAGTRERFVR